MAFFIFYLILFLLVGCEDGELTFYGWLDVIVFIVPAVLYFLVTIILKIYEAITDYRDIKKFRKQSEHE